MPQSSTARWARRPAWRVDSRTFSVVRRGPYTEALWVAPTGVVHVVLTDNFEDAPHPTACGQLVDVSSDRGVVAWVGRESAPADREGAPRWVRADELFAEVTCLVCRLGLLALWPTIPGWQQLNGDEVAASPATPLGVAEAARDAFEALSQYYGLCVGVHNRQRFAVRGRIFESLAAAEREAEKLRTLSRDNALRERMVLERLASIQALASQLSVPVAMPPVHSPAIDLPALLATVARRVARFAATLSPTTRLGLSPT